MIFQKYCSTISDNSSIGKNSNFPQKKLRVKRNLFPKISKSFLDYPVEIENDQTIKFSSDSLDISVCPIQTKKDSIKNSLRFEDFGSKNYEFSPNAVSRRFRPFLEKRDFLSSSLVCGKCKHKIRRGGRVVPTPRKNQFQIVFSESLKPLELKPKNSVFDEPLNRPPTLFDSAHLDELDTLSVISSLSDGLIQDRIRGICPIGRALVFLFLKGKLSPDIVDSLSQVEQTLVKTLICFKNGGSFGLRTSECEYSFKPVKRRTEENIKFIFIRAIKHMIKTFKNGVFKEARKIMKGRFKKLKNKEKLEYAFFGFYFGSESVNLATSIDQFMLPKKNKKIKKKLQNQFSSISKQYLQLVSVNPHFLCDLRFYLRHFFMEQMLLDTFKKVSIILSKTIQKKDSSLDEAGVSNPSTLEKILRNTHMPWNIHELQFGLDDLKNYLRL